LATGGPDAAGGTGGGAFTVGGAALGGAAWGGARLGGAASGGVFGKAALGMGAGSSAHAAVIAQSVPHAKAKSCAACRAIAVMREA